MHNVVPIGHARMLPWHKRSPAGELGYLAGELWRAQIDVAVGCMSAAARIGMAIASIWRL